MQFRLDESEVDFQKILTESGFFKEDTELAEFALSCHNVEQFNAYLTEASKLMTQTFVDTQTDEITYYQTSAIMQLANTTIKNHQVENCKGGEEVNSFEDKSPSPDVPINIPANQKAPGDWI